MTYNLKKYIRTDLEDFAGYSACKAPELVKTSKLIIKLDANENLYGAAPTVRQAMAEFNQYHIYPDATQSEIRRLLSEYTGVAVEQIVCGAGSDQLIDLLLRLFINPGDEVINCPPTFAMYKFYTELNRGKIVNVPRDASYNINIAAINNAITPQTKLIFIAAPNNPTGTAISKEEIRQILDLGVPTVVDEAYYEFTGQTMVSDMSKYPNLMILRTFSKWAGLAGLRVGYGLFPPIIADYLSRIKDPYSVNIAADAAVRQTMLQREYMLETVKKIVNERQRLYTELSKFGWLKPYPSVANFILCKLLKGKAKEVQHELESKGILVRCFDAPMMENCLRFSVGKPEDTDGLLKALGEMGE
ncbi:MULTISPECIES: histidinol-phosphate transaminase [Dehalococcoides]|jgi:histidinol-phosphate aminotransferase|uniref:Histidinol-phosphate aminotransferase n=1 Tax=Dehalococcoides mccartyi TaxID=61435 RepID=A0A1S7AXI3_9CHLR|nr:MULTISPECIES: histidinol-phosphate transaminase [Dehalococcoides]AGG06423.1 histidinol-phosphate aminotransferase [Dehalococcoides mccartyi DCMB5]AQU05861.1 histidinol-phosphate transaminase [Dehalococcoides mccartyi]AQU07306.1 histidinol-phosphate transaminase [Dehalococcoides mccartyi]AQX73215.1 histidinol-phosphate transaminase [Dehalococcoides mccartyi]AQX74608.1 histidinol-phosphate transaminase [Dehalococcoides mccartyi]